MIPVENPDLYARALERETSHPALVQPIAGEVDYLASLKDAPEILKQIGWQEQVPTCSLAFAPTRAGDVTLDGVAVINPILESNCSASLNVAKIRTPDGRIYVVYQSNVPIDGDLVSIKSVCDNYFLGETERSACYAAATESVDGMYTDSTFSTVHYRLKAGPDTLIFAQENLSESEFSEFTNYLLAELQAHAKSVPNKETWWPLFDTITPTVVLATGDFYLDDATIKSLGAKVATATPTMVPSPTPSATPSAVSVTQANGEQQWVAPQEMDTLIEGDPLDVDTIYFSPNESLTAFHLRESDPTHQALLDLINNPLTTHDQLIEYINELEKQNDHNWLRNLFTHFKDDDPFPQVTLNPGTMTKIEGYSQERQKKAVLIVRDLATNEAYVILTPKKKIVAQNIIIYRIDPTTQQQVIDPTRSAMLKNAIASNDGETVIVPPSYQISIAEKAKTFGMATSLADSLTTQIGDKNPDGTIAEQDGTTTQIIDIPGGIAGDLTKIDRHGGVTITVSTISNRARHNAKAFLDAHSESNTLPITVNAGSIVSVQKDSIKDVWQKWFGSESETDNTSPATLPTATPTPTGIGYQLEPTILQVAVRKVYPARPVDHDPRRNLAAIQASNGNERFSRVAQNRRVKIAQRLRA